MKKVVFVVIALIVLVLPAQAQEEWDKSSIVLIGQCEPPQAFFTILNHGEDMDGTSEWRLLVDGVQVESSLFMLKSEERLELRFGLTGEKMKLEADQRPGHPGNSNPKVTVTVSECNQPQPTPTEKVTGEPPTITPTVLSTPTAPSTSTMTPTATPTFTATSTPVATATSTATREVPTSDDETDENKSPKVVYIPYISR